MNDESSSAATSCGECGARLVDGLSCWEQLGMLLAWEHTDPELAAQHFVTVASYNLQHPAQFADEAITQMITLFIAHLDQGLTVDTIRRRVGHTFAGHTRVLRPAAERQPRLRAWPMTIADVYVPEQPQGAAARVRAWAVSIRQVLVPRHE